MYCSCCASILVEVTFSSLRSRSKTRAWHSSSVPSVEIPPSQQRFCQWFIQDSEQCTDGPMYRNGSMDPASWFYLQVVDLLVTGTVCKNNKVVLRPSFHASLHIHWHKYVSLHNHFHRTLERFRWWDHWQIDTNTSSSMLRNLNVNVRLPIAYWKY